MRSTVPTPSRLSLTALAALLLLAAPALAADPAGDAAGKVVLPASAPADGALARFLAATGGLTMTERYRHGAALPDAERRRLLAEYGALSEAEKATLKAAIPRGKEMAKARRLDKAERAGMGTVTYDTGVAHSFIPTIVADPAFNYVGNRFTDAFLGSPHSISKVTFQVNGNFFGSGNSVRIYGPPAGTTATGLFAAVVANTVLNTPVVLTLPAAITGLTGSFLVGIRQFAAGPTPVTNLENPAVDVNSGGQGFHGMSILGAGAQFNPAPTVAPGVPFNAIVRVTGNNLPVELTNFTID